MSHRRSATLLRSLNIRNLRGYAALDIEFGPGPQLLWGPNAAGKTTLVEAIVLLALGRSHRTTTDSELIRWGADFLRIEGVLGRAAGTTMGGEGAESAAEHDTVIGVSAATAPRGAALELTLQVGGRKRIQVNGVPRRPGALAEHLRTVLFAPEDLALVKGDPGGRRSFLDDLLVARAPRYAGVRADYERVNKQRTTLLKTAGLARRGRSAGGSGGGELSWYRFPPQHFTVWLSAVKTQV